MFHLVILKNKWNWRKKGLHIYRTYVYYKQIVNNSEEDVHRDDIHIHAIQYIKHKKSLGYMKAE